MKLLEKFNVEEGKEYIYLVMVEYKDKTLLKVGYTKTLNNRMDAYELHNPDIQLLKIREGTRDLENYMHKKFEKYSYPIRKEWFYYNEEIIKEFDTLDENVPIIDNIIDIDLLKDKIYDLLKPGPISNLIKIYYDKYEDEINKCGVDRRVLYKLLLDTFSFINQSIKNFILSFDYSGIPSEIDPNINYQIVIPSLIHTDDICIDLDKLLGKQKLKEGSIKLFIKAPSYKQIKPEKEFNMRINTKEENTKSLLNLYQEVKTAEFKETLADKFIKTEKSQYYLNDYVSVSIIRDLETGEIKELIPEFNKTIMSFEVMALEILYIEYKDRFTTFLTTCQNDDIEKLDHRDNSEHDERILSRMIDIFKVGDKYSKSKVKNILRSLYKELGYRKTAKATDLNYIYVLKDTKVKEEGKWVPGIEILEKR